MNPSVLAKAKHIELVIFDVDGVLTNGQLSFTNAGDEIKTFHVHDGLGLKLLQKSGINVGIITSRMSKIVDDRMASLGIKHVYQGAADKQTAYDNLKQILKIDDSVIAYVGDDLPDLPLIQQAHLGITVPNGSWFVKEHADWCTTHAGGHGAVREICEQLMRAQSTLDTLLNQYVACHAD